MIVRYVRRGGLPPRDDETLAIEDNGEFQLWRTIGWLRAGRFGGVLSGAELTGLRKEAEAVRNGENFTADPALDAAIESVDVDGRRARMDDHEQPPGPWGPLTKRLRALLNELTGNPLAAVELVLDPSGRAARLRHVGTEPIDVGLSRLHVEAHLIDSRGRPLDAWTKDESPQSASRVTAGRGWVRELPLAHGFDLRAGQHCQVWVMFDIFQDSAPKRARLVGSTKIA